MKLIHQLLDYSTPWRIPNVYLFTGNPIIKNNGTIVMGRGAAKQVRDTYPGIDGVFAKLISQDPSTNCCFTAINPGQVLGWFKVKDHWADPAELNIIKNSVKDLITIVNTWPMINFHMNYPGIGNGRLSESEVESIINMLPNNVLIYK